MPKPVEAIVNWTLISLCTTVGLVLYLNPLWFRKDLMDSFNRTRFGWLNMLA